MTEIRALTAAESEAFAVARLVSGEMMPYFMHALFAVHPVAAPGLGTFAVDARWRLYLDPDLLLGDRAWAPRVAAAVLLHEVGHLLREHSARAAALPQPWSPTAWNYAADAEINDDLLDAGIGLPEGVVTPQLLDCEPGGIAEDYYAALVSPQHDLHKAVAAADAADEAGEVGCGSGAGAPVREWEATPVDDAAGLDAASADLVRRRVARSVIEASGMSGRGRAPGNLVRWAGDVLSPPQVPWEQVLRNTMRRVVAHKAGGHRSTYSRPSRRTVPGIVLPAHMRPAIRVSVVVDTSGSMSLDDLNAAAAEVAGVLHAQGVDRDHVRLLACDAAVSTPVAVRSVSDIELVGGGGTDMRVGIAAAEAERPVPDVVVVLTDGDTPWPSAPSRSQLVCVIIGNSGACPPPWAHTVHVPSGAAERAGVR